MSEPMTIEKCRDMQSLCSKAVFAEIADLRRATQTDIAAIRQATQDIDRGVSRIMGYLGMNGNPVGGAFQHHRDREQNDHLHQRLEDMLNRMDEPKDKLPWQVKVMWGIGIFAAMGIASQIFDALGKAVFH